MKETQKQAEVIELYKAASPELLHLLQRRLGSFQDAEEVAQDAFEKLYASEQRDDIRNLRSYFFTMANRMALNVLRRRKIKNDYLVKQRPLVAIESASDPARIAHSDERLKLVKHAIQSLPQKRGTFFCYID